MKKKNNVTPGADTRRGGGRRCPPPRALREGPISAFYSYLLRSYKEENWIFLTSNVGVVLCALLMCNAMQ